MHSGIQFALGLGVTAAAALATWLAPKLAHASEDQVLADFESGDLSGWQASPGLDWVPVDGRGWDKRAPTGFEGRWFLATGKERHTNNTNGALTSAPFRITKRYVNFLMAGELHPAVNVALVVNKRVVARAYGNNAYDFVERSFDARKWKGQQGTLVIADEAEGKSLLRVDHFRLSNTAAPALGRFEAQRREESDIARPGEFRQILNATTIGNVDVFEHSLARGPDGRWHVFAAVAPKQTDPTQAALGTREIVHASARRLTDASWRYEGVVLQADADAGERFLWSPFVLHANGKFHMFYTGAGKPWSGWRACAPAAPRKAIFRYPLRL